VKIAVVITQLNEHELLRANILYHKYLGVEEFIIFPDNPDDGTSASIIDIPGVTLLPCFSPSELPKELRLHSGMKIIIEQHQHHICARQMVNAMLALEIARASGCDWLLSMDADEFICTNLIEGKAGELQELFEQQPDEIETLLFRPLEILPMDCQTKSIFQENHIFLNEFIHEGESFRSVRRIRRDFPDPIRGGVHSYFGYLGHNQARSAVRTSLAVLPNSVHYFKALSGEKLVSREIGWSLHLFCYSFNDFIKKFSNFRTEPDRYIVGGLVPWYMKRLFCEMVNGGAFTLSNLNDYYKNNLIVTDDKIEKWKIEVPGSIVSVDSLKKALRSVNFTPDKNN